VSFNAYNTRDPAQWLRLKHQEARATLDVVRAIHPDLKPRDIIFIVTNTIRAQLAVNKLAFVQRIDEKFEIGIQYGYRKISSGFEQEIQQLNQISKVDKSIHPLLFESGVEFVVPLGRKRDSTDGWFLVADFFESEEECDNDLIFIETMGNILMITLENIRLFEVAVEQRRIRDELEIAEKIQKQSLPNNFEIHPKLDIYAQTFAHFKVGGDFYDVFAANDEELYICIADVSGKGISAALLVSNLQANLHALFNARADYEKILLQLHGSLKRITKNERFVTLFLGKINLNDSTIEYINAGHNPPLHIDHKGNITELTEGCIPLGIMDLTHFQVGKKSFLPGDLIFLYTDGLSEQPNPEGELLDYQQLLNFLPTVMQKNAKEIIASTLTFAQNWAAGTPSADDITMMVVKNNGI
jgi:sigma-B regulation protein RsbU (phosphoserine phosphatase)